MRTLLLVAAVLALACQPPPSAPSKPAVSAMDAASYESEIAHLRERLMTAEAREPRWPIINSHEHLLKARHLPNYLQAARKIGVAQTIIVTSTQFTLFGKGEKTYPSMAKNWLNVRKAMRDYPGEILAFATVDPSDPQKLAHLKKMVAEGAVGVKLYSGHSNLYDKPLNDPSMDEIYQYLEETQLPINWHINLGKYAKDFEDVMSRFPNLNVMIPHYGVAFWRYQRLEDLSRLMRKFPTVYVDTSLGTREILIDGMYVMAKPGPYAAFAKFFEEFQDRIVYGSDSVITGNKEKTASWYYSVLAATMDHLEEDSFTFPLAEAYSRYFKKGRDPTGRIPGFGLSDAILEKIYVTNPRTWLGKYKPVPSPPTTVTPLPSPEPGPDLEVVLGRDGSVTVGGAAADLAVLSAKVKAHVAEGDDHGVALVVDPAVAHGRVVEVMDAAKAGGARRIGFRPREKSAADPPLPAQQPGAGDGGEQKNKPAPKAP